MASTDKTPQQDVAERMVKAEAEVVRLREALWKMFSHYVESEGKTPTRSAFEQWMKDNAA